MKSFFILLFVSFMFIPSAIAHCGSCDGGDKGQKERNSGEIKNKKKMGAMEKVNKYELTDRLADEKKEKQSQIEYEPDTNRHTEKKNK